MGQHSDILENQVDGRLVVSREGGGTLFGDHASDGGFIADQREAQSRNARGSLRARMTKTVTATGQPCSCPMPSLRRGNPSRVCVRCGGTA